MTDGLQKRTVVYCSDVFQTTDYCSVVVFFFVVGGFRKGTPESRELRPHHRRKCANYSSSLIIDTVYIRDSSIGTKSVCSYFF